MNPFMTSVLSLFAKPLGAMVNNALMAASASFVTWSVSKGMDSGAATTVAAGVVGALSALVQWGASTQGVNISVINSDPTNGVTVVKASDAKAAGIPSASTTLPKA
jgi:hypothetical protein